MMPGDRIAPVDTEAQTRKRHENQSTGTPVIEAYERDGHPDTTLDARPDGV